MYLFEDTNKINEFKEYCLSNFNEDEACKNYLLFRKTIFELDIEAKLLNSLNTDKVYKAYGNYCSSVCFVLDEYNQDIHSLLDKFINKANNKELLDYCVLYKKKTDVSINNDIDKLYDKLLIKEVNCFNCKYVLNFSELKIEGINSNSKIFNLGTNYINTLNNLFNKDNKTQMEVENYKKIAKHLLIILKNIL